MENKSNKYIWIAFCAAVAILHIVFLIMTNSFGTGAITAINVAYILIFTAAIIRELNLNKFVVYGMLIVALLMLVYGIFFTTSL